jgi:hypothetical protein
MMKSLSPVVRERLLAELATLEPTVAAEQVALLVRHGYVGDEEARELLADVVMAPLLQVWRRGPS